MYTRWTPPMRRSSPASPRCFCREAIGWLSCGYPSTSATVPVSIVCRSCGYRVAIAWLSTGEVYRHSTSCGIVWPSCGYRWTNLQSLYIVWLSCGYRGTSLQSHKKHLCYRTRIYRVPIVYLKWRVAVVQGTVAEVSRV